MNIRRCCITLTPRTPVFARVFQTLEVSFRTSLRIPRTPVFVRVFQTLEVTIFGSPSTSLFSPRTPVFVRVQVLTRSHLYPSKQREVKNKRNRRTSRRATNAVLWTALRSATQARTRKKVPSEKKASSKRLLYSTRGRRIFSSSSFDTKRVSFFVFCDDLFFFVPFFFIAIDQFQTTNSNPSQRPERATRPKRHTPTEGASGRAQSRSPAARR